MFESTKHFWSLRGKRVAAKSNTIEASGDHLIVLDLAARLFTPEVILHFSVNYSFKSQFP